MGQPEDENDGPFRGNGEESFPMVEFQDGEKGDDVSGVKYKPDEKKKEKTFKDIMLKHADKSSLSGVTFIRNTKYWTVTCIWTILLLAATGVMIFHLHELGKKYFEYEKQTHVELTKGNIKFPAITFCNTNILRKSKLHLASINLNVIVENVNPDRMLTHAIAWNGVYENETVHFDDLGDVMDEPPPKTGDAGTSNTYTMRTRMNNFLDEFNTTYFKDDDYFDMNDYTGEMEKDTWEATAEKAALNDLYNKFVSLYLRENGTTRRQMGHQLSDMLLQCSFNGMKCHQKDFKFLGSTKVGNCYTLQYDKFIARRSGPTGGLSLMVYLEADEFIPGITNSKGIQLVIHERDTIPFPDSEGLSISAGMATSIGLRKVDIRRLGQPFGDCRSSMSFLKSYGIKYTAESCNQVCLMEKIREECGCFDETKPIFYRRMKGRKNVKICQRQKYTLMCMTKVQWNFEVNHKSCFCYSPCRETAFRQTVSSKPWPTRPFANLMAMSVCKEKPGSPMCKTNDLDLLSLRENFAKITIYFESLDYEKLTEEEDYSMFQFISDIGGTIGLYVGLSVLGAFEFVHLIIVLLRHYLCPSCTPP